MQDNVCPGCASKEVSIFYTLDSVPVNSVLLIPSHEEAVQFPRGEIALGFCKSCGFISNYAFDPVKIEYSTKCEETQGFSPTFIAFHQRLAAHLIERYDLRKKHIIEIGCGKGEFLHLLCLLGGNRGVGFDPAYVVERDASNDGVQATFIKDFYSEKYAGYRADFICCKMTLEHIQQIYDFVSIVRRSIGDKPGTTVFFQVPDTQRILREIAFWDIYYEHCSYFSTGSLVALFRKSDFDVVEVWKGYDDQYLMLEARAGTGRGAGSMPGKIDSEETAGNLANFVANYKAKLEMWKRYFQKVGQNKQRAVLWGSGSKAVSFLTTLNIYDDIKYIVDINPYRHRTFSAGTGQEIVPPEFLKEYDPNIVIVMNSIYKEEIHKSLREMNLDSRVISVDDEVLN